LVKKQLEMKAAELEKAYLMLDSIYNGIMAIDDQGIVSYFNAAAERMSGIKATELIGKHIKDCIPKTGLIKILETGKAEYGQKIVVRGKTYLTNRSPLFYQGKVMGAISVFQEITELEEISSKFKTFERLNKELDTIFNSSYDGLMITDENGRGIKVNCAHTRLTGVGEEHFVGKNIEELFDNGVFRFQSITIRALKEGRRVTGIQKMSSGKEVLVTGSPVFDKEGKVFRVVTNVHDISELNRLKEKLADAEALNTQYQIELQEVKGQIGQIDEENIVTHSKSVQKIYELASHVANSDATILVLGESGVGKEGLVRMIHRKSYRAKLGKFVHINCGAIPENLIESELFGYEPGAFTGAEKSGKKGLFETANKGTLFLDEIGELPLPLQVKLLRVLQEQEVYRLGGTSPIKLDVRIVAASNNNLLNKVEEGIFREDLYYRLYVVPIELPPLRERPEDILPLVMHYVKKYNQKYKTDKIFSSNTLNILQEYNWPGNIRQLVNVVERLIVTSQEQLIDIDQLNSSVITPSKNTPVNITDIIPLREAKEILEKKLITMALKRHKTVREAAKALSVSHSVVVERINQYKINRKES